MSYAVADVTPKAARRLNCILNGQVFSWSIVALKTVERQVHPYWKETLVAVITGI